MKKQVRETSALEDYTKMWILYLFIIWAPIPTYIFWSMIHPDPDGGMTAMATFFSMFLPFVGWLSIIGEGGNILFETRQFGVGIVVGVVLLTFIVTGLSILRFPWISKS